MLASVNLDDHPQLMTGEISEVRTDRCLAPEMMFVERRLPQMLPKLLLSLGRVATQRAGARNALVNDTRRSLWHPPPTPDP